MTLTEKRQDGGSVMKCRHKGLLQAAKSYLKACEENHYLKIEVSR